MEVDYPSSKSQPGIEGQDISLSERINKLELSVLQLLNQRFPVPKGIQNNTPNQLHPYQLQQSPSSSPVTLSPGSSSYSKQSFPLISTKHRSPNPLVDLTNSPVDKTPSEVFLEALVAIKKANPLPTINDAELIDPHQVIAKYPKLLSVTKVPTLAVKLAKESFFGKEIMACCTVRGTGQYHALPETKLKQLKEFLLKLCVPRNIPTTLEFEVVWKGCTEAIGQACKSQRKLLKSS